MQPAVFTRECVLYCSSVQHNPAKCSKCSFYSDVEDVYRGCVKGLIGTTSEASCV